MNAIVIKSRQILIIGLMLFASSLTHAQDVHMTQYDASPIIMNPALTGMYESAKYRLVNQYRSQWDAISYKSYLSSSIALDMPYMAKWGIGGYILNDNSSRFYNSFNLVLSGAHDITSNTQKKHKLMVGLQVGLIYKNMRQSFLTFDNQYTQGTFDENLPSGETFDKNKRFMPEVNLGMSYINTDETKKYRPYGGLSLFHCTYPKDNFVSGGPVSHLPIRYLMHGGCQFEINDKIYVDPKLMAMKQRNAWEFNIGARGTYDVTEPDFRLITDLQYRVKDAFILGIGIFHKSFIYKVSYDFNTSKLSNFSKGRGGLEFSLTYIKRTGGGPGPMIN